MTAVGLTQLQQSYNGDEWPTFVSLSEDNNQYCIELLVHPSIKWFNGHFPQQPVLPGVVQTHWAAKLSSALFHLPESVCQIHNLKFHAMILPETTVTLRLQHLPDKQSVKFHYSNGDTEFAEGRLEYAAL